MLKRSTRMVRRRFEAGARRSNAIRNPTNHNMVYTVLIGNSAGVNRRGKSETWPATAKGRKAPRCRRSFKAIRLKGMMTRSIAFSWTCHPNRKEA